MLRSLKSKQVNSTHPSLMLWGPAFNDTPCNDVFHVPHGFSAQTRFVPSWARNLKLNSMVVSSIVSAPLPQCL